MAVSASKNYSVSRADIISAALRKIGEYDQGESVSGDETVAADVALNLLVKEWVTRGIDVWLRSEVTLFLQKDVQSYALGLDRSIAGITKSTVTTFTTTAEHGWRTGDTVSIFAIVDDGPAGDIETTFNGNEYTIKVTGTTTFTVPVDSSGLSNVWSSGGVVGPAHATTAYVETTLSAAEALGQTVISVTSSSGMAVADFVGIKTDDNTIHWSTIVSVDSATQITIEDATDVAAASGNKVYAYSSKAPRPQKIVSAFRRDTSDLDTEVSLIGESQYLRQTNKGSSGPCVELWYQPTLTTGKLSVWPVDAGSATDKLVMSVHNLPDDFDTAADTPDFPIEAGNALVWSLAAELSAEYGIPVSEQKGLWAIAEFKLNELLAYDTENADVVFSMDVDK